MSHNRKISVTGLGYVGLPVAVAFGKQSEVIGFDISESRISELKSGVDHTNEVTSDDIARSKVFYTSDIKDLKRADFHIIGVPTPINEAKQPDLSPLLTASQLVGSVLKKGDIVVYESTVYPGATEDDCVPVLESASGLKCGKDFFIGYSPERINPGDKINTFTRIIKVVSGQNDEILDIIASVYESVVEAGVHRAPSIKVAEAAKVIENTQRDINISLMNELALIFNRLNIDTSDVLKAAGTKWNFLNFQPGLVGGHCIGVDPYYLTHKSLRLGYSPRVILSGRSINDAMGRYVARMVIKQLIKTGRVVKNAVVTILGFTFKQNVPDVRNTQVIDIVRELQAFDVEVQVFDPLADLEEVQHEYGIELCGRSALKKSQAVVLAVVHEEFLRGGWDYITGLLEDGTGVVFDVKSVLPRNNCPEHVTLQRL